MGVQATSHRPRRIRRPAIPHRAQSDGPPARPRGPHLRITLNVMGHVAGFGTVIQAL